MYYVKRRLFMDVVDESFIRDKVLLVWGQNQGISKTRSYPMNANLPAN